MEPDQLEAHSLKLQAKYAKMEENEVRFEEYRTEDADFVLVGYGIVSRILRSVVDACRAQGRKVGLLRPITLFPFPKGRLAELAEEVDAFLAVELSAGQMVDDVRLAVNGRKPVLFYGRMGGNVPTVEEIHAVVLEKLSATPAVA
jgi:pyruvate/2-oxoacid:ferredoxin oxidoreductase alpha subunit